MRSPDEPVHRAGFRQPNPTRPIPWNPARQTVRDLAALGSKRSLFLVASGSAYFWAVGVLSQINIDQFATKHLDVNSRASARCWRALTLGIGGGALLAGIWSRGKVELGLVPLGGLGIALTSILVAVVPGGAEGISPGRLRRKRLSALGDGHYGRPVRHPPSGIHPGPQPRGIARLDHGRLQLSLLRRHVGGLRRVLAAERSVGTLRPLDISSSAALPPRWSRSPLSGCCRFETMRLAVRLLAGCMYRVRVEGVENVPPGGALVVANHVSWADGVLLGLACPRHPRMVAYAKYFDSPWLGWFGRLGRIIPIGATRKSMAESIRAAREALHQGELVGIFPEGGISRTGEIQEFRPGFLSILKDTGAPVVPAYLGGLWGSIFSFERGRFFWKWPRRWPYPVTIRFGRPIPQPESVEEVRRAVEELKGEIMRP